MIDALVRNITSISDELNTGNRRMAREPNGTLWAIYTRDDGTRDQIYVSRSTDGGVTWGNEEQVSAAVAGAERGCALSIDSTGALHATWTHVKNIAPPGNQKLYYAKRSPGGGWSIPIQISDDAVQMDCTYATVAVDSLDNVHVVFMGGVSNQYYYYRQFSGGMWQPQELVSADKAGPPMECLAVNSNDEPAISWVGSDREIYFSIRTGGVWQAREAVTVAGIQQDNSLAFDAADNAWITWWGAALMVRERTAAGVWQAATDLLTNGGYRPSIAVDGTGAIDVIWIYFDGVPGASKVRLRHKRNLAGVWGAEEEITTPITTNPWILDSDRLLWANWPVVAGLKTNVIASGYAAYYMVQDGAGNIGVRFLTNVTPPSPSVIVVARPHVDTLQLLRLAQIIQ